MKIAYVITRSDSIGGAHIHLLDLATEMQKRGHIVRVFVGGNGPFCQRLAKHNIAHTSVPNLVREIAPLHDARAYGELKHLLKAFNPDLVHVHSSKAGVLGRLASRSLKLPCIFTAHGWAFTDGISPRKQQFYKLIERWLAPFAHTIITVSNYDRNLALANKVGNENKLVTVLNGVRDTAFPRAHTPPHQPETATESPPLPVQSPVRLVMVARFDEQKDHSTLIKALAKLKTRNWQLALIGDGPLKSAAISQAKDAGLEQEIHFAGSRNDVPARLAASDIFVLSTHWEGLPLSILEALAAGLPVVASDVGGVSETITDGQTGYLVNRSDADGMAEKLEKLIENTNLRNEFGTRARKLYLERFGLQRMIDETESIYKRAAGHA